ncbi:MAG: Sporulation related domain [Rhodobacteraceae bacterium HLUCCA12]|nr:MAG: Sporulation related domain [Rhodobacteraceae bacterium HLUCCA12]
MFVKFISAAALFAAMGAGATAQTGSNRPVPAEMPPADYSERQYVDSRGCVFIRAGFDGRVNWVPRYNDERQPMCGYDPTMATAEAAPQQRAPRERPATEPVAMAAASEPRAEPERQAGYRSAPATGGVPYSVPPERSRPRTQAQGHAQVHQASSQRGLDTRWSFYDRTGPSPCTNLNAHSQMYMVPSPSRPDLPLRCGPQEQHPADAVREMAPRGNQWEPWDGANPSPTAPNVYQLPPTYAPRWPDAHMQQRDVPQGRPAARAQRVASHGQAPRATVSTMGTAPESAAPRAESPAQGRYVQIGTFGVAANAQNTVARLEGRGLPVATNELNQGGRTLRVVMAGPFDSRADINAALGTARALGFGDAFVR